MLKTWLGSKKGKDEPPRRVVFHFGPPKTATSTFQEMLRLNAARLGPDIAVSARDDLTRGLRYYGAKILTDKSQMMRKLLQEAVQTLHRSLRDLPASTVLISDENLFGVFSPTLFSARFEDGPGLVLQEIETALAGWDLRYVCYMREPRRWRDSCYNQSVKWSGVTEPYARWIADHPDLGVPQQLVDRLKAELGDRLTVLSMEEEVARDGYAGRRVLELAGVAPQTIAALTVPPPSNVAISPAALEFVRRMNGLGLPKDDVRRVVELVEQAQNLFKSGEV